MRLRYNIYIIIFSILILSINNIHATNYYVNDNSTINDKFCFEVGNAGNDGLSPFTPMDSLKDILANHDLEGGDTIYVDTGSYNEGQIDFPADDSGSAALGYVNIQGAGAGIYGSGTENTDISGYFVLSSSVQYLHVSHIKIYAGGGAGDNNFDINGADNIIISDNDFYNGDNTIVNQGSGTSSNVVIARNISHDSMDCFELRDMKDVQVIRNIMFSSGDNGVTFWDSTNVEVRNNTIYDITTLQPIEFVRMGGEVLVINNLMFQVPNKDHVIQEKNLPDTPNSVYTFKNNLGWDTLNNDFFEDQGNDHDVAWVNNQAGWTNNIYADPFCVDPANDDFNLLWNSPCIDAGDPNYNNEVQDGRIDIGAIEFQGIHHFELIHDGLAAPDYWEKVTIRALDFAGNVVSNFAGAITLWVEGVVDDEQGEIDWMNLSGVNDASFIDFGGGDDRAVYEFVPADNGVIEVFIRDDTKESLDVEIFSPFFYGGVHDTDIDPKWLFVTANVPQILNHFEIFHDQKAEVDQWEQVLIFAKNAEDFTIRSNIGTVTIDVGAVLGTIDWENVNTSVTILDSTSIIHTFPDGENGVLTLLIRDDTEESVYIRAKRGAITSNVTPGWLHFTALDHFTITHDGSALQDQWETIRIEAMTGFDKLYVDFTGTITVSVIPDGNGMVEWRFETMCGTLTDLGNGKAEYTFEEFCNGGIVDIQMRTGNLPGCDSILFDIEVISAVSSITDDDKEGLLTVSKGKSYYVNDNSTADDMYCSNAGNDANDGLTPFTPKRTIESIIGQSAPSPDPLQPGDKVYIDTGTYTENVIIDSGEPGGDATGYIKIIGSTQGSGTVWNGGNSTILEFDNTDFWEIKNIQFINASANDRECIDLQNGCGNLRFYNNTFSGSYRGIFDGTGVVNSIFYGNKFFNIDREGMRLQSAGANNLIICRNLFYDCGYNSLHSMDPDNSDYVQNLFYNNSGSGGVANVDFEADSDFITFKYNTTAKAQNNNEGVKWFDANAEVSYSIAYQNTADGFDGPGGDMITYCNSYNNGGADFNNCIAGVGCSLNDPQFVDANNNDYRLRWNSPLQGAGAGGQSIGRYTTKITPGNALSSSTTYYSILFVTTPDCSIPSDATLYVEFLPGFNVAGVTGASSPTMNHNVSASGSGNIVEVQLSGGTPKAADQVEIVIISNVVNPPASGTNYYIRYWITDICGDLIEWPDDSNMFQISAGLADLDVSISSRISYNTGTVSSLLPGYTVVYSNWYSNAGSSAVVSALIRNGIPSYLEYAGPANSSGGFVPSFSIDNPPADQTYGSPDYDDGESSAVRWVRWTNGSLPSGGGGSESGGVRFSCYFTNTSLAAGSFITNISTAIGTASPISNSMNVITVGTLYGGSFSQADDLTNYTGLATIWTMFLTNKGNIDTTYTLLSNVIRASNSQIADWSISFSHASLFIPIGNFASFTVSVTPLSVTTNGAWIDFDIIASIPSPSPSDTNYIGDNGIAYGGDIGKTNNGTNWPGMEGKIVQQNNTTDGFPVRLWRIVELTVLSISKSISNVELSGSAITGPIPGSTVTYSVYYSNTGSIANNMIIYDRLPANAIYFSTTPWAGWGAQYATNTSPPDQSFISTDYTNVAPMSNVRWIRWTNSLVADSETGLMIYSVIIK